MKYISKNITSEAADALQTFIRLEKEKAHYDNFKQSDGKDKVQKSLLEELKKSLRKWWKIGKLKKWWKISGNIKNIVQLYRTFLENM